MTILLVPNDLWAAVAPHLPPDPPRPKGGRPRVDDRRALTGIVFVLVAGIPWEHLPQEVAGCSGMTCWRRLRDWQRAGAWEAVLGELRRRLGREAGIDWDRAEREGPAASGMPDGRMRPWGDRRRPAASGRRAPGAAPVPWAAPAAARASSASSP